MMMLWWGGGLLFLPSPTTAAAANISACARVYFSATAGGVVLLIFLFGLPVFSVVTMLKKRRTWARTGACNFPLCHITSSLGFVAGVHVVKSIGFVYQLSGAPDAAARTRGERGLFFTQSSTPLPPSSRGRRQHGPFSALVL